MMLRGRITIILILGSLITQAQLIHSEKYRKQLNDEYASALFKSDNAYMIVPDDDIAANGYFNVFQYLQGRVPGLTIYNAFGIGSIPAVNYRTGRPAFFLDEMPVDLSALNSLSMPDIALIKIFRPPFIGATGNGPYGAIAVYTKRGDEEL